MSAHGSRLGFFLLLSVAAHMLALATWQAADRTEIAVIDSGQPLQLTLSLRPQPTTASKPPVSNATPLNTQRPQRQPAPARPITTSLQKTADTATAQAQRLPSLDPSHATLSSTIIERSDTVHAHTNAPAVRQLPSLGERIQQQLLVKFAMHRHYPAMAVRNAWQGRVNLGLRVEADGLLSNIRVIKSSGYHILDQAAISSLGHVAALPEAGSWLQGRHIDVILPVIYKLTDS